MATVRNFRFVAGMFYVEFLKGKLVIVQALWHEEGNGSIAALIFNLSTKLRLLVICTHSPFYARKKRAPVVIKLEANWIWTPWTRDKFIAIVGN